jgi:hypothetical protein
MSNKTQVAYTLEITAPNDELDTVETRKVKGFIPDLDPNQEPEDMEHTVYDKIKEEVSDELGVPVSELTEIKGHVMHMPAGSTVHDIQDVNDVACNDPDVIDIDVEQLVRDHNQFHSLDSDNPPPFGTDIDDDDEVIDPVDDPDLDDIDFSGRDD